MTMDYLKKFEELCKSEKEAIKFPEIDKNLPLTIQRINSINDTRLIADSLVKKIQGHYETLMKQAEKEGQTITIDLTSKMQSIFITTMREYYEGRE